MHRELGTHGAGRIWAQATQVRRYDSLTIASAVIAVKGRVRHQPACREMVAENASCGWSKLYNLQHFLKRALGTLAVLDKRESRLSNTRLLKPETWRHLARTGIGSRCYGNGRRS